MIKEKQDSVSISVAIATYNGQDYLYDQLMSINNQRDLPDEIVVSDDNSMDETINIINEFKSISKIPLKLVVNTKEQSGVIYNFLNAFKNCNSQFICYCDQDDYWEADKIFVLRNLLIQNPNVKLAIHKSRSVNEKLEDLGVVQPNFTGSTLIKFPSFYDDLWGFGHQMIFNVNAVKLIEDISIKIIDLGDVSTCFDLSIIVASGMLGDILLVDKILTLFRRHGGSLTVAGKEKKSIYSNAERSRQNVEKLVAQLKVLGEYIGQSAEYKIKTLNNKLYLQSIQQKLLFYKQILSLYQSKSLLKLMLNIRLSSVKYKGCLFFLKQIFYVFLLKLKK